MTMDSFSLTMPRVVALQVLDLLRLPKLPGDEHRGGGVRDRLQTAPGRLNAVACWHRKRLSCARVMCHSIWRLWRALVFYKRGKGHYCFDYSEVKTILKNSNKS
jgi:hypothetical protein